MTAFRIAGAAPDRYWRAVADYLDDRHGPDARLVVPDPLLAAYANGVRPADMAGLSVDAFAAIVVHKGDFTTFPADALHMAFTNLRPVFANEVFVVLAAPDPDRAGNANRSHLGTLGAMQDWARAHADPALVATASAPVVQVAPAELLSRLAGLIARDLVKPVPGTALIAVAETAVPFEGSSWFWGDDAAKVAELFCLPALRREHPDLAERLIDFVLSLSPDGIIHRRSGPAGLTVESDRAADFRLTGPFTITFGDLTRGRIMQAMRFNDGRTRPLVAFTPGTLEFTWAGRPHTVDIADAICAQVIERRGETVVLRHLSSIRRPGDPTRELATVDCIHVLHPGRSAIRTEITVRPTRFAVLKNVALTPGAEALDLYGHFDRITLMAGDGTSTIADVAVPGAIDRNVPAAPRLMTAWESSGVPGHAVGVHIAPDPASSPFPAPGVPEPQSDRLTSLRSLHRRGRITAWTPLSIGEDRLVTVGGYYDRADEYLRLMREASAVSWCRDASMSYDTGVELNAVATYLFFATHGDRDDAISADRVATLRAWFDRHLALYLDHIRADEPGLHGRLFVRGLAFVILALDVAARCFPDGGYDATADGLADMLLDMQVAVAGMPDGTIFLNGDAARPELDSQGAALLALARRAWTAGPDARLSDAIGRGLAALHTGIPAAATYGNAPLDHATILLASDRSDPDLSDTGFWTYKLGLALRAFEAIDIGVTLGRIDLSVEIRAHLNELRSTARAAVAKATVGRGQTTEVLTSAHAGETNSETQPWVAMGLVPDVDRALAGLPPAAEPDFTLACR